MSYIILATSRQGRFLLRFFLVAATAIGLFAPLNADAGETVKFAVLAFRPKPEILARWQPLSDYLNRAVPGHRFEMAVLHYDELEEAIAQRRVDFVLTQPAHYVLMTYRNGLSSPLATLVENESGHALDKFGGVIFTRAGRADIATLADLKGKILSSTTTGSLGGYQMQAHELAQAGIRLPQDAKVMETGQAQDRAIQMVLEGKADAGFARTGVIEAMAREGKLDAKALKILNLRAEADFPYLLSTRLYPEWAFAAMPNIEEALSLRVAAALLSLPHDGEVAQRIGIHGFTIPADYHPVDDLLREMRLPPFDATPEFSLHDVWSRYRGLIAAAALTLSLLLLAVTVRFSRLNRILNIKRSQLKQGMVKLEDSEARQRAIFDALGEGVYGVDTDGRCLFINATALSMLNYSEEDVLGRDQHALLHHHRPDGRPYPAADCPIIQTARDGEPRSGEEWFFRKDGAGFPVGLTVTPLLQDGLLAGAAVVFRDISESSATAARLRMFAIQVGRYADEVEELYQHAPCGYHSLGDEGEFRRINDTELKWLGYLREEVIGKLKFSDLLTPDSLAKFRNVFLIPTVRGAACDLELEMIRKDGTIQPVLISATPVLDDEYFITSRVTVLDMTERKKTDRERSDYLTRLEEKSRHIVAVQEASRRRLAAELHDRTSPNLAAIGINMSHISMAFTEEQSPGFAERMEDTRALIEDTAASIREICADMRPPVLDYAGLPPALEAYSQLFSKRTGIAVHIDCAHRATRLPQELESVLFRVFQEALTNCAKHAYATSIMVELNNSGSYITLTVCDDGIGFDSELLWGGASQACGLGILNMREMIEFAGGNFTIESTVGKGTRIGVEILNFES